MSGKFCLDSDIREVIDRLSGISEALSGQTILLSGAQGFLGKYIVEVVSLLNAEVLSQPCKLVGLDNKIIPSSLNTPDADGKAKYDKNITLLEHDVTRPIQLDYNFDLIIHAAGIASPFYYRSHPLETLDVTITGSRILLEMARDQAARFVFFSTSEVYGDPSEEHLPTPESYRGNVSSMGPRACYDESKRLGDTLCYIFQRYHGVHTNSIRPFNIYGPGMDEFDYRVLPNFAHCIKSGQTLSAYGSGNQTRTYCYITDALVGFFRVMIKGVAGEAYNIGNTQPEVSVLELIKILESVVGESLPYRIIEHPDSYPSDEPQRRCPDIRKATTHLDYHPKIPLEVGLARFIKWTDQAYTGKVV